MGVAVTQKLWGGRFGQDITTEVLDYTLTVDVDVRLWHADLWQSMAHTLMLGCQGVIPAAAARASSGPYSVSTRLARSVCVPSSRTCTSTSSSW
jgi:hypothetical protein